jgi:hypothetical protein
LVTKRSLLQGGVIATCASSKLNIQPPAVAHSEPAADQAVLSSSNHSHIYGQHQEGEQPADAAGSDNSGNTAKPAGSVPQPFHDDVPQCHLDLRSSEVLAGPGACLAAHGSRTVVVCEGCHIGGDANYGVLAAHGAQISMHDCEVQGVSTTGVDLSSKPRAPWQLMLPTHEPFVYLN